MAANLAPEDPNPNLALGSFYYARGDTDWALQAFEEALRLDPGSRANYLDTLGWVLLKRDRLAEAEAIAYAHGRRVVHRDLKPANVVVGSFGETVVVDWGLARELGSDSDHSGAEGVNIVDDADSGETVAGTVLGTPNFMPPEQARGLPVDERADVFALGGMLYFLLTGAPPYAGVSGKDVVVAAASGGIEPVDHLEPDAPPDLVAAVHIDGGGKLLGLGDVLGGSGAGVAAARRVRRASSAGVLEPTGCPQFMQKRASVGTSAWQFGHGWGRAVPQLRQKRAPSGFCA